MSSSQNNVRLLSQIPLQKSQDGNTRDAGETVIRVEVYLIDYLMLDQLNNVSHKPRLLGSIQRAISISENAGLAIIRIGERWETQAVANLLEVDVHSRFILLNNLCIYSNVFRLV
jgi:hypothetical protein